MLFSPPGNSFHERSLSSFDWVLMLGSLFRGEELFMKIVWYFFVVSFLLKSRSVYVRRLHGKFPLFFYQTPLGLCPFCSVIMYLCIFPVPGNLPFFLFWSHPVRPVYLHEVGAFCFELSSVETREQIWKIYPFENNLLMWVVFKRNFCNWLLPATWESRVTALTIPSL